MFANFIVFIGFYCFTYALQNSQKHFSSVFGLLYLQIFWSFIIILSKYVSKDDSPITMVSYQYTLMTFFALPLAIYFWETPSLFSILYVFIGAISGTILHLCLGLAYKYADLSVTQPIWFSGLIFGSAFGMDWR